MKNIVEEKREERAVRERCELRYAYVQGGSSSAGRQTELERGHDACAAVLRRGKGVELYRL